MISYEIETVGFDKQIAKLANFDRISNKHLRSTMDTSVKYLERKWKMDAPVRAIGGGRYRTSIAGRVKSVTDNVVVGVVSTNVKSAKGFPYPAALEKGSGVSKLGKAFVYHYASGPRRGTPLKGRVKRVFKMAQDQIIKRFKLARTKIVKELEI